MNWTKGKFAIAKALRLDLTHPQVLYGQTLQRNVHSGDRWLDVGCGYQILPAWAMPEEEQARLVSAAGSLTGVDVDKRIKDHPLLRYRVEALGGSLPFRDQSFDLVTANMVVEHVDDPKAFLADIYRVLRPQGHFLFHTPNYYFWLTFVSYFTPETLKKTVIWKLEHREPEDVFPTRYRMNTPWEISRLAKEVGFRVENLNMVGSNRIFDRLGPIGWIECFVHKGWGALLGGRLRSNIIGLLQRPS